MLEVPYLTQDDTHGKLTKTEEKQHARANDTNGIIEQQRLETANDVRSIA